MADFRLREDQRDRWDWFELERWAVGHGLRTADTGGTPRRRTDSRQHGAAGASAWAERFHAWLRAAGWPGERSLSSVEHQTVMKFHAALAEFGTLDAVTAAAVRIGRAVAIARAVTRTPFEPETQAHRSP